MGNVSPLVKTKLFLALKFSPKLATFFCEVFCEIVCFLEVEINAPNKINAKPICAMDAPA